MNRFNILLHGEASEAADILSGDAQPRAGDIAREIRAALTNALNRIDKLEKQAATTEPGRRRYKVAAVPLVDREDLNVLDDDVAGVYFYDADSEEEALDEFHDSVAIKVLDDFEIDVEIDR